MPISRTHHVFFAAGRVFGGVVAVLMLLVATASAQWSARVYEAADILPTRAFVSSAIQFISDDGVELTLELDPSALEMSNPNVGSQFHPVTGAQVDAVLAALRQVEGEPVDLRIYCLPGLPRAIGRSFSRGREIFLAPGLAPMSAEVIAYTLAHEIGHAVQHERMPGRRGRAWLQYLALRGIEDTSRYGEQSIHRDRPGEIFAEDFRVLYGGAAATVSGSIENEQLDLPHAVEGLQGFMKSVIAAEMPRGPQLGRGSNYPNPFNPATTIRLELADAELIPGAMAQLDVFDLRGRRVRSFTPLPVAPVIEVRFDGRDDAGVALASGRYVYRLALEGHALTGSMMMVQ